MSRRIAQILLGSALLAFVISLSNVYVHRLMEESHRIEHRPWHGDADCEDLPIRFGSDMPKMALASYPGSGNTWIRGIIERLTGYFTGSLYEDKQLYAKGFYGEMMPVDCGCTVVQKTHLYPQDHTDDESAGGRALLIIRNPYEALISFRNFEASGQGHTQTVSADQFSGSDWDMFVSAELVAWRDLAIFWIQTIRQGGILHYENLIRNREEEFRKLAGHLGVHQLDDRRLSCTLKHDFKTFKRNSTSNIPKDPFSREQKRKINKAIETVNHLLIQEGYEGIPFQHYKFYERINT